MVDNKIAFSSRLKELRSSRGLTQENVARELNITTRNYALWEQGKSFPNYSFLRSLCLFFSVSSDYLLCLIDDPLPLEKQRIKGEK